MDASGAGRFLIALGIILIAVGAIVSFAPKIPWLGRLPGDFSIGGPNWRVYVPLGTCLAVSLLLSLILKLLNRK